MNSIGYVFLIGLVFSTFAQATSTYNPSTNILTIDSVIDGATQYNNVIINMGSNFSVVSVGSYAPVPSGSGTITLAQLNACPQSSNGTLAQLETCLTGTIIGTESGLSYPCTLSYHNDIITLSTTDNNQSYSVSANQKYHYLFDGSTLAISSSTPITATTNTATYTSISVGWNRAISYFSVTVAYGLPVTAALSCTFNPV